MSYDVFQRVSSSTSPAEEPRRLEAVSTSNEVYI